jgi:hypothetical protein
MSNNQPVPIKDVLADPTHPAFPAATEMLEKLGKGEIKLCACLGAAPGEPYCPCEMTRRGLPASPARVQAADEANRRLAAIANSGAFTRKK